MNNYKFEQAAIESLGIMHAPLALSIAKIPITLWACLWVAVATLLSRRKNLTSLVARPMIAKAVPNLEPSVYHCAPLNWRLARFIHPITVCR